MELKVFPRSKAPLEVSCASNFRCCRKATQGEKKRTPSSILLFDLIPPTLWVTSQRSTRWISAVPRAESSRTRCRAWASALTRRTNFSSWASIKTTVGAVCSGFCVLIQHSRQLCYDSYYSYYVSPGTHSCQHQRERERDMSPYVEGGTLIVALLCFQASRKKCYQRAPSVVRWFEQQRDEF